MAMKLIAMALLCSTFGRYLSSHIQNQGYSESLQITPNVTCRGRHMRAVFGPKVRDNLRIKAFPEKCNIEKALRVACGPERVSSHACQKHGCCYNSQDSLCYYQINACSLDGHFVFSLRATDAYPPLNPGMLVIKSQPPCFPVFFRPDVALFKFGVTKCGSHMSVNGALVNYEAEAIELVNSEAVFRQTPISCIRIQCQYARSALLNTVMQSVIPTNPPPASAQGIVGVQMRIATDGSFSSFHPRDHLPLSLPLDKPVYVQVSTSPHSPDPTLSLRVHDCFAYPASRHSLWTLLHDGCPNHLDNMQTSIPVGEVLGSTGPSQVRRFDVKTFAFINPQTGKPSMEELYFYCWVEICSHGPECDQQCSTLTLDTTSSESTARGRRTVDDRITQLVSLGPIQLAKNSSGLQEDKDQQMGSGGRMPALYCLSVVCALVLLFLPFLAWTRGCSRWRNKTEPDSPKVEMVNICEQASVAL
ncbi:zona pellucida sperm-binding protein 4-like isoform X2 [Clupea harengus]|uniref:Zona pellucida sperm-binding protein 4-like isoform X2 n=1 Tax=Clupea harengus TaxID=7950 RepID=A0A6P3VTX4_CLUHA|nr:zona pellucida sperm-binding protein 4-like isoform X2 [Clupea harengus]